MFTEDFEFDIDNIQKPAKTMRLCFERCCNHFVCICTAHSTSAVNFKFYAEKIQPRKAKLCLETEFKCDIFNAKIINNILNRRERHQTSGRNVHAKTLLNFKVVRFNIKEM